MATPNRRRSALQELPVVLSPLSVSLLDDSDSNLLSRSFASPAPSPDEYIIRQRGRRSISVTWSPPKHASNNNNNNTSLRNLNSPARSPLKTPTKNNPQLQMVLRSSPRKRLLMASEGLWAGANGGGLGSAADATATAAPLNASPNQKLLDSTKRLRIAERPCAQRESQLPLAVLLRGYSQAQLIELITERLLPQSPALERRLREELPLPDVAPMEQALAQLKRNIFRSLPSSRLVKKDDSVAFARARLHLGQFKAAVAEQLAQLHEARHYDALLDYVLMAWGYVRGTPVWENHAHNAVRRHCFKNLAVHARSALQHGGVRLGVDRLRNFWSRLKDLQTDCDLVSSCAAHLDYLLKAIENNDGA